MSEGHIAETREPVRAPIAHHAGERGKAAAPVQQRARARWADVRDVLPTLLAVVLVLVSARTSLEVVAVDGNSMLPNFAPSQQLLVNKLAFGAPARGDIVVLRSPQDGTRLVKRVIGVGGDKVELIEGRLQINGAWLDEPYLDANAQTSYAYEATEWDVPADHLFVLGDNRAYSRDSRDWGFLPVDDVEGQTVWSVWPLSRWNSVDHAESIAR